MSKKLYIYGSKIKIKNMSSGVIFQKKKKGDEFGFLYILYVEGNKRKKVSLKHKMLERHFNDCFIKDLNNFKKTTLFDYKALNIKINNLINDNTIFEVKEEITTTSYLKYFEKYIIEHLKRYTSKSAFTTSLKQFKEYLITINKDDITFNDLSSDLLDKYKYYQYSKGKTNTTIKTYFTAMKCVFNKAIKDKKITIKDKDIFRFIEIKKDDSAKGKRVLTNEDISILKRIKRIEYKNNAEIIYDGKLDIFGNRMELTDNQKETYKEVNNNVLFYTSRMFLFSLFSNGMRFSDLFLLRFENFTENTIEYITMKNNKKLTIHINYELNRAICLILGLENIHSKLKNIKLNNYNDNELTYKELQDIIFEEQKKFDRTDTTLMTYKEYNNIDMSNKYLVKMIDRIYLMNKEINKLANKLLYEEIKKMNKKDFLFKKFINTDIFNDYDNTKGFTDIQNKKYKTLMAKYDRQLNEIAKKYDLTYDKLSSHNARHTFTNIVLTMDNINLLDISSLLGHSNISTTQKYISGFKFDKHNEINEEFSKRFTKRY